MSEIPKLIGMRPLEKGRLALAFWDKKVEPENALMVRVYDLWKKFESRKDQEPISRWFEPVFFATVYLLGDCVCWGGNSDLDIFSDDLYYDSVLVKEDFRCLK